MLCVASSYLTIINCIDCWIASVTWGRFKGVVRSWRMRMASYEEATTYKNYVRLTTTSSRRGSLPTYPPLSRITCTRNTRFVVHGEW